MSGREDILARVRAAAAHRAPHPGAYRPPPREATPEAFARALEAAGGRALGPLPRRGLAAALAERLRAEGAAVAERLRAEGTALAERRGAEGAAGRWVAEPRAAAWLGSGPFETAAADAAPHSFEDVEVAVVTGALGVAESGAVALLGAEIPHRALPLLCRRLVVLLPEGALAADLHEALARLPDDALAHHHVTWVCGPSKTADIEQTLVRGAHGPLELDVVWVHPEAADR